MATELETIASKERIASIARNAYKYTDEYNSNHTNALATGDDKGKGENAGQVGSLTDINTRTSNLVKNEYGENNGYSSGNRNALSDGDEKGKGETSSIGGLTDINVRKDNMNRNFYSPEKGYGVVNPNALSDGDEKGKGQIGDNGTIGSKTDIFGNEIGPGRNALLAKNIYGENNQYNQINTNALSNGDEKGKGQIGDNGSVGSKTDIFGNEIGPGRNSLLAKNEYNENKQYPDFTI